MQCIRGGGFTVGSKKFRRCWRSVFYSFLYYPGPAKIIVFGTKKKKKKKVMTPSEIPFIPFSLAPYRWAEIIKADDEIDSKACKLSRSLRRGSNRCRWCTHPKIPSACGIKLVRWGRTSEGKRSIRGGALERMNRAQGHRSRVGGRTRRLTGGAGIDRGKVFDSLWVIK